MRLAGNVGFGSFCWIFACGANKAGRVLRKRANLLPARERSITPGWCQGDPRTHASSAPLPGDPRPPGMGAEHHLSLPAVLSPPFPRLPQLRFPQTKHPPGFQPFILSRRQDFGIHSSPAWAGGCSHGGVTGWGGTQGVGARGWGASKLVIPFPPRMVGFLHWEDAPSTINVPKHPDLNWQEEAEAAAGAAQRLTGLLPMSLHPDHDGVSRKGGVLGGGAAGLHGPSELWTRTRSESSGDPGGRNPVNCFQLCYCSAARPAALRWRRK